MTPTQTLRASTAAPFGSRANHLLTMVLLLAMACIAARPQTASPVLSATTGNSSGAGFYRIAGTVVNAASGEPVRRAAVAVLAEEDSHTVAAVESDGEGRFAIEGLKADKYQLTASKRGYRTAFYDEHGEFNSAIVTGPGQDTGNLRFRLTFGATIHGTVTTDGGDAVEGAKAMLFLKPKASHSVEPAVLTDTAITDDTGAYE